MDNKVEESEEERIISVFRDFAEYYLFWEDSGLTKEKALAWLEKQKSVDVSDKEFPEKIYITPNLPAKWLFQAIDDECVEYIRKDLFLKNKRT